jgi:hypothetical protein
MSPGSVYSDIGGHCVPVVEMRGFTADITRYTNRRANLRASYSTRDDDTSEMET